MATSTKNTRFLVQRLCKITIALVILAHLAIENSSCGGSPIAVKVIGELVGATVEAGILRLVSNEFRAKVVSNAGGNITKYLIDQIGIKRKDSSEAPIQLNNVLITDGKWQQVTADNLPAFLLVSQRKEVVEKAKTEVPATCWLTQKAIGDGRFILTWTTHNAINAKLDDQAVSLQGYREVSPSQTTTYLLKVQGSNGEKDEESATIKIDPSPTPSPTAMASTVKISIEKIIVDEDGSPYGGNDWDFKVYLNESSGSPLMGLSRQEYHDNQGNDEVSTNASSTFQLGTELKLIITGHNYHNNREAEGKLTIPLEKLAANQMEEIDVKVPDDPKKGHFKFRIKLQREGN